MASPQTELQRAIYSALTTDAELMSLISGVFDRVMRDPETGNPVSAVWGPENGYISFGRSSTTYEDYDCIRIESILWRLECWSRRVGRTHCQDIVHAAQRAIKRSEILGDHAVILTTPDSNDTITDVDGLTTRGTLLVQCEVEDNAA